MSFKKDQRAALYFTMSDIVHGCEYEAGLLFILDFWIQNEIVTLDFFETI